MLTSDSLTCLCCVCVSAGESVITKGLSVTQSSDISIVEGEAVFINCCWSQRDQVSWRKTQTAVKYETAAKQESKQEMLTYSSLTFRRVDSGKYACKLHVELP